MDIALQSFLTLHDQYLDRVNHAYATGDTSGFELYLAPGYHGRFGTRGEDEASYFNREQALQGMAYTAQAFPGCQSGCENRQVHMPSEREAFVFCGKPMDFGNGKSGYAYVIEVWRQQDGIWLLVRATVESA